MLRLIVLGSFLLLAGSTFLGVYNPEDDIALISSQWICKGLSLGKGAGAQCGYVAKKLPIALLSRQVSGEFPSTDQDTDLKEVQDTFADKPSSAGEVKVP